jgi:hypothetical protein
MTNITETVQSALTSAGYGQYASYAAPVIEALEQREENAVAVLREKGMALGASEDQIDEVLTEAGLIEPTPEADFTLVGQDEDSLSLTAQVAHLAGVVERLVQAAASRGLRI